MKRREFICNSLVALAGTMLFSGCGSNKIIFDGNKISRIKFKDMTIPLLGFGTMRLPKKFDKIDMTELEKMVEYAISHGANYFDTAYMYMDSKSELAIGKVLKNYKRQDLILADKSPVIFMKNKDDVKRIFEEQLRKCQTDYFDFYMVHNINNNSYDNYKNFDVYEQLKDFKRQGLIKHLGFSFHGTTNLLKEVLKEHSWEFCQLQINYLDWESAIDSKTQYELASKQNLPIIVMEPLRGGVLSNLTGKPAELIKKISPNDTPTSYALRWAGSKNGVLTVLSGMSNLKQMQENISTFTNFKKLTEAETNASEELSNVIKSQYEIGCTTCKYCLDACPMHIAIPQIFSLYNAYKVDGNKWLFNHYYKQIDEKYRADKCIKCGMCLKHCPQTLPIPELLTKVDKEIQNIGM